jgi:hypothetical protein
MLMHTDPNYQGHNNPIAPNAELHILVIVQQVGARILADRAARRGTNTLYMASALSSPIP